MLFHKMPQLSIGFTGTREGTTAAQSEALINLLSKLVTDKVWSAHHGDCCGADEEFHHLACEFECSHITAHIPDNETNRAFCASSHVKKPLPYLERNKNIVHSSDIMIACPKGSEILRSGTWSTIRYARGLKRRLFIIYEDGRTVEEDYGSK